MKKPIRAIADYWAKYYTDETTYLCTLCGNKGTIDTGGATSRAGVKSGRLNWCICPNGQVSREMAKGKLPTVLDLS